MIFITLALLFVALVSASFRLGDFVEISGLVAAPEYNGSVAMVMNPKLLTGRVNVRLFLKEADSFKFIDLAVKPEKLVAPTFKVSRELRIEEILENMKLTGMLSSFVHEKLNSKQEAIVGDLAKFMFMLCKGNPENILRLPEVEQQFRIIGAWINYNLGHAAMVEAAEFDRRMLPFIERAWNGIGRWLA